MHKQAEITEQTKQNLIEAFWSIYMTKRIDKITVKEITNKAGYNRGTFYEYFQDIYEVLEVIENLSLPTLDELPPLIDGDTNSPTFINSFVELYQKKYKYYNHLLGDNGDPAFQRKLKNSLKSSIIRALEIKGNIDLVEIDFMLEYILSGMIGILIYMFQQKPNLPEEKIISLQYTLMQGDMLKKLQKMMK
ncbi:MAG: TetR/AcrR family transcriptional regulator [Chloroflexi bacterium HGW-Chloroflexi-10]|nr:MAG: TetR/AcrR family transcriptional regulator [Chloroflexi bacterium HGW-Chloroflexi-10]